MKKILRKYFLNQKGIFFYKMSEIQISFTNDDFGQTTGLTLRDQQNNHAKKIE